MKMCERRRRGDSEERVKISAIELGQKINVHTFASS